LRAQSVVSDSLPIAQQLAWLPNTITNAPPYVNATAGSLYQGIASTTLPSTSLPIPTSATTQSIAATPIARSTKPLVGMGAGIFLFVAGGAISGYDWWRSRRMPAPVQESLVDLLEDDLLDDDQEL